MMQSTLYSAQTSGGLQLRETLDCGQAFRWQELPQEDGFIVFEGVAMGKHLKIRQENENIRFFCSEEEFQSIWFSYFDLGTDYAAKKNTLSKISPALMDSISYAPGIRLLKQEPFETMCSFILSQNCNIPRIKGMISRLCQLCGEPIGGGFYSFPTPAQLAAQSAQSLEPVRAGFRTGYLLDAAEKVAGGMVDFDKIQNSSLEEGREILQTVRGIGPKVSECILLFGFHKLAAFPMDVWMKRAMSTLFPGESPGLFGEDAGLAQQYIFHYFRTRAVAPEHK